MALMLTEADVQNCTWTLVEVTDAYRRYVGRGTHPVTGVPITVQKTEYLAEDNLLAFNAEQRNDTDGQRWSNDRNGVPLVKVGSVPLNKFFAELAPKMREGDTDHLKWWLERDQNEPFRTRRGRL